jgi:ribulose bisphosphate carboxylase small subunit
MIYAFKRARMSVDDDDVRIRVLDDFRQEPGPKMWRKCKRLSWKTKGERFTMFVTLSNCRMKHVNEFYRISSTWDAMQRSSPTAG